MLPERTAVHDGCQDLVTGDGRDLQFDAAIVEQEAIASADLVHELCIGRRDTTGAADKVAGGDPKLFALVELDGLPAREPTRADLRSGQILEYCDLSLGRCRGAANLLDRSSVLFAGAVRKVEAKDIDAGRDELAKRHVAIARRADGGDDLGVSHRKQLTITAPMGQIVPDAIENYLATLNRLSDPLLDEIARHGRTERLTLVDAETGALLYVLVTAVGARKALELGTAISYSSIWIARALPPGGMLFTMELDPGRAKEARRNIERAGLSDRITVMVGDAALLIAKVAGPFDFIFQDGDKRLYEPLLDRLVDLLRPGGLLATDNVLWEGQVVPEYASTSTQDPEMTSVIASYNQRRAAEPRLRTSTVPIRDGVAISVRVS